MTMPTIEWTQLRALSQAIFVAAGAPDDVADYVGDSLVQSNLMGHDSHGVIRIPYYVEIIREGTLIPTAVPTIVRETATTALVDGNWAFGQVAARFGTELAIQKAKQAHLAAVGVVRCNHTGRLGEYATMAAEQGMFGLIVQGGNTKARGMVPYGGIKAVIGLNPYAFAMPAGERPPVVVDFATSTVAEGKLQVARAKQESIPEGWILDKHGRPSTNPADYYAGGSFLPFGGHKGYGLAVLADLLAGALLASDVHAAGLREAGAFILALDVRAFRSRDEYGRSVDDRLAKLKAVPPAPGFAEVLVPGEPEYRSKARREQEGIPIPEETWNKLVATGRSLGLDLENLATANRSADSSRAG